VVAASPQILKKGRGSAAGCVESLYTRARGGPFPFGNTTGLMSAV